MNIAVDPTAAVKAVTRTVKNVERDGKPAKSVIATRVYDTDAADLWNALTTPDRLKRWFLPVSGDLKLGGRYQFTGNAGGTITECKPNKRIAATWEFGPAVTWVVVTLSPAAGGGTQLELEHTAPIDPHWANFGPGAVGVGWDLGLMGLGSHLRDPNAARPPEADTSWPGSPEGKAFIAGSSSGWGQADIDAGASRSEALAAAESTRKFYTGEAPPQGM